MKKRAVAQVSHVPTVPAEPTSSGTLLRVLTDATARRGLLVVHVSSPPGSGSPEGAHSHDFEKLLYVLAGTMGLDVAGTRSELGPDSVVVIPPGVVHENWNAGADELTFLAVAGPASASHAEEPSG
jgi:quercetin dioxygenase-like cupin family protein